MASYKFAPCAFLQHDIRKNEKNQRPIHSIFFIGTKLL